jgi:hypothetical protein
MAYKHVDKTSGQLIQSADWNTMGHAIEDLGNTKVERAGDTIAGSLTVGGKLTAPAAQFTSSLGVTGAVNISGSLSVGEVDTTGAVKLGNSDIYFTNPGHAHTGFGNTQGYAAIENDSNLYQALMILGRSTTTGGQRRVKLWDYLHVYGSLEADNMFAGLPFQLGAGQTPAGATAWQPYAGGTTGIFVIVDTSVGRFSKTPLYLTSLHGAGSHWDTTGATSVYAPTPSGFTIYVRWADGRALTPADANGSQWHIQWLGIQL